MREGLAAALYQALSGAPTAKPPSPGPSTVEQRPALLEARVMLLESSR